MVLGIVSFFSFIVAAVLALAGFGYLFPSASSDAQSSPGVGLLLLGLSAVTIYAAISLRRRQRLARTARQLAWGISVLRDAREQLESEEARSHGAITNLLEAAARSDTDVEMFTAIARDFITGSGSVGSARVAAVQRRLTERDQLNLLDVAETVTSHLDMNDAARNPATAIPGFTGRPPVYVAGMSFQSMMSQLVGLEDGASEPPEGPDAGVQNLRNAITSVVAEACAHLREQGRREESALALLMGGQLFLRAPDWWNASEPN